MSLASDLIRAADKNADDAIRDMQDLHARVWRRIKRLLRRIEVDADGKIDARAQVRTLLAVRMAVSQVLDELGAPASVTIAQRRTEQAARDTVDALSRLLPVDHPIWREEFRPNPDQMVRQALVGFSADIARIFDLGDEAMRRAVNAGVTGRIPIDDLIAQVAARIGATFSRAEAAVETAVMSVGRSLTFSTVARVNDRLGSDFFVLRYVGPLDKLTRPFCRYILADTSRTFTEDAVKALDNGQGLPCDTSCGGWRCRHQWAPMTNARARQSGKTIVTTDDVPAINAAWKALSRARGR